jgi:hypothetical protein
MPYRCCLCNEVFGSIEALIPVPGVRQRTSKKSSLYFSADRRLIHELEKIDDDQFQKEVEARAQQEQARALLEVKVSADPGIIPQSSFRRPAKPFHFH